jgi:hypothetical protein
VKNFKHIAKLKEFYNEHLNTHTLAPPLTYDKFLQIPWLKTYLLAYPSEMKSLNESYQAKMWAGSLQEDSVCLSFPTSKGCQHSLALTLPPPAPQFYLF